MQTLPNLAFFWNTHAKGTEVPFWVIVLVIVAVLVVVWRTK